MFQGVKRMLLSKNTAMVDQKLKKILSKQQGNAILQASLNVF